MFLALKRFFLFEIKDHSIEDILFMIVARAVLVLCVVFIPVNYILGLSIWLNYTILISAILYFILVWHSIKYGITFAKKLLSVVLALTFLIPGWFFNGGILGSESFILILVMVLAIFILNNKQHWISVFFVLGLIVVLFYSELHWPQLVSVYPSETSHIYDVFLTLLLSTLIIGILVSSFKKSYENERLKLLAVQKDLIKSKNELERAKIEAEKATYTKSMFLANMSHELRTPLNGIIGVVDLLKHTRNVVEQEELINTLGSSSELLLTVINDILDVSKIEAGKVRLHNAPLNMPVFLKQINDFVNYRIKDSKNQIEFLISSDNRLAKWFVADESRLKQILLNLLNNAVKFTSSGYISLVVNVVATSDTSQKLIFKVSDTGIGMPPEKLSKLFVPFYQIDNSMSKRYTGTGLGLSICKSLVEMMGGSISANSIEGNGSTFTVELELKLASDADLSAANTVNILQVSRPEKFSILLAEDNRMNQIIASKIFKAIGCSADIAENGAKVLEMAANKHYDIVFMDVQMPIMDGLEATRKLLASHHIQPKPIIIAMTANAMKEDETECFNAGMNYFMSKPITIAKVQQMLDSLH